MMKKQRDDFWASTQHVAGSYERDRKKRIHVVAEHLVSKEYSRKMKGKFKTLQMSVESENLLHERVKRLELELHRETLLYDEVRRGKNRASSLRRRFVYWRLFYQYRLTISMISWLLDANPETIKSNIGAAYHKLS
jgi:hypothetical protein